MATKPHKVLIQKINDKSTGFTLNEILFVIGIVGILATIAVPSLLNYRYKGQISHAITEIKSIEKAIDNYRIDNNELPNSLADINMGFLIDPWSRPYQYLRIDGGTTPGINGNRRRDKNANPVNSDYDLYSMGKDGETTPQFSAKQARDDIVRANDGRYIGLAEKH